MSSTSWAQRKMTGISQKQVPEVGNAAVGKDHFTETRMTRMTRIHRTAQMMSLRVHLENFFGVCCRSGMFFFFPYKEIPLFSSATNVFSSAEDIPHRRKHHARTNESHTHVTPHRCLLSTLTLGSQIIACRCNTTNPCNVGHRDRTRTQRKDMFNVTLLRNTFTVVVTLVWLLSS